MYVSAFDAMDGASVIAPEDGMAVYIADGIAGFRFFSETGEFENKGVFATKSVGSILSRASLSRKTGRVSGPLRTSRLRATLGLVN